MTRGSVCALVVSLCVAGGCASPAKHVEKNRDGGIVSIPNNTDAWPSHNRRAALDLIQKHVGVNYEIVQEREVVVGQSTTNNQQVNTEQTVNRSMPFLPAEKQTITNNTTSRDVTEWRIWYRRVDAPRPGINGGYVPGRDDIVPTGGAVPQDRIAPSLLPIGMQQQAPRYISGGTGSHLIPSGGGRP